MLQEDLMLRSRQHVTCVFPTFYQWKCTGTAVKPVTSHPWTRSRSMYSQFCALTSHSLQNNNGSPYGYSVYAEIDVRQYNIAIKVRSAILVCLHLATTIPCAQVVWRDVPGMLKSRGLKSWLSGSKACLERSIIDVATAATVMTHINATLS